MKYFQFQHHFYLIIYNLLFQTRDSSFYHFGIKSLKPRALPFIVVAQRLLDGSEVKSQWLEATPAPEQSWLCTKMTTNTSSRARVPTPKQLSSVGVKKDEFETFWHILLTYCQQDADYLDFFDGGNFSTWQALSSNPTRGINVPVDAAEERIYAARATREANRLSGLKRATLNSL